MLGQEVLLRPARDSSPFAAQAESFTSHLQTLEQPLVVNTEEARKPCTLSVPEGSRKNSLTRRDEEVRAVFWERRGVDSNLLRNELWVPRDVGRSGSAVALVLRSHCEDCDIACF